MINLINHYKNGEKLYEKIVSKVAKKYNLTMMEFNIIIFLHNNPLHDTASEIVKYRHLVKSHVSTSIKSLIDKGLIITKYKKDDRKSIHLFLTNKCQDIIKDGLKAQDEYKNMVLQDFSDDDVNILLKLINRIDDNINKYLN